MRNGLLLGLTFVLNVEAKSFDELESITNFNGFTVTVEYQESDDQNVIRRFYEEIMNLRPSLNYYKNGSSSLPSDQLPAVIVRCNDEIVYSSYGRTPPRLIWNLALNYFVNVLDKENKKCTIVD